MNDTKDDIRKKVRAGIEKLTKPTDDGGRGIRSEEISYRLHMANSSVLNWKAGRRIPKYPVIRQIEEIWGIKIL